MRDWGSWISTDTAKLMLAGAAGGIVRWVTLRQNWREGTASVIVGSLCALYLGPIVEPLLEPLVGTLAPGGDAAGFSSFVVGLGGISLAGLLIDFIAARGPRKGEGDEKP
jgi:hypothetical protein